jgi:hypothetical protein
MLHFFDGEKKFGEPGESQRRAEREYLDQKSPPTGTRKQALLDTIHEAVRPQGLACMTCHSPEGSLVDLERLGYPPSRAAWLRQNATISQILSIEAGQTFHLPAFMGSDERK